MALLAALHPEIMPHVNGCPTIMIDDAILKTVIDFCNRSRAYRFVPDDIETVSGVAGYEPDLPTSTAITWLISASLNDVPLGISDVGSAKMVDSGSGITKTAVLISDTEIELVDTPLSSETLKLNIALRPTLSAKHYPDHIHAIYQEHIAAGVLAKLCGQPNKPWSASTDFVVDARNRYESGIIDAAYQADRGRGNMPARTNLSLIGGR